MLQRKGIHHDDALIEFIRENKENIYRLAYSYVRNKEDALDIVQESIQKALVHVHRLRDEQSLKSWFYKIVVNTSLDFLRKNKRVTAVDDETLDYYASGVDDRYEDVDLERAVKQLPTDYQSVIILRFFEDLKIGEVAAVLNENTNTIKTRLYKALKLLRIELQDDFMKEVNGNG